LEICVATRTGGALEMLLIKPGIYVYVFLHVCIS
jgi:hypothetical protein